MERWSRYPSLVDALPPGAALLLEEYCLLGRIGDFDGSERIWKEHLEQHASNFLYTISYLDNVLRQSRYGSALDHLTSYRTTVVGTGTVRHSPSQSRVLSVMHAYLNVFTSGWLRAGVFEARETLEWLSTTQASDYDDYQIHALELCLHILKYAQNMSTYTTAEDLIFPSGVIENAGPWSGYREWAWDLARTGRHWEGINVIKVLASAQKVNWSIHSYDQMLELMASPTSVQRKLSRIALLIAQSRKLFAGLMLDEGIQCIREARASLPSMEDELGRRCSRQRLELEMADLEQVSGSLNANALIQRWLALSELARESQEWGIESTCREQCAQIAAANRMNAQMYEYSVRLQIIEQDLERDIASLLSNRCGMWRAGDRAHLAQLLRWFDDHEAKYPRSGFFTGEPTEDDLRKWDIPWSSARMAQLRYIMYSALGDVERAKSSRLIAERILPFVPFSRMTEMGLADRFTLEWFNPLTAESVSPFEVLAKRMQSCYPRGAEHAVDDATDWYRFRQLRPLELQNVVICRPFNQPQFESRMLSLRPLLANDVDFDRRATQYLIGRLYLEHYAHAKVTGQLLPIMMRIVGQFDEFVNNLAADCREVKQMFERNSILAWQEVFDVMLKDPNINPVSLRQLPGNYQFLLQKYEGSHLASNLPAIGSLYGRIAETQFRTATTETELQQGQHSLDEAMTHYDDYRVSFSALNQLAALETKASIRQGVVGDQEVLNRAVTALMTKWSEDGIQPSLKAYISGLVWDLVQKTKNRALNDALSSKTLLSADDRATIRSSAESTACLESWQKALDRLSQALHAETALAVDIDKAREDVRLQEQKMLEDPLCRRVMAMSKGAAASAHDMSRVFRGSKDRIILVDWFTADVPLPNKLYMVTLEISPELKTPQIHYLADGIAVRVHLWSAKFLHGARASNNRKGSTALKALKQLAGLVQPLAEVSQPNDVLVFCPTTKSNLHRLPLHAIEMWPPENAAGQPESGQEYLPMLRNRIVYTYSHSLLRLSVISQQNEQLDEDKWTSTFLSPLASISDLHSHVSLPAPTAVPADAQFLSKADQESISDGFLSLAHFLSPAPDPSSQLNSSTSTSTILSLTQTTKSTILPVLPSTNLLLFLGHVHLSPQPLQSHVLLYYAQPSARCVTFNPTTKTTTTHRTDPQTSLTGTDLITSTRLRPSSHVILLACASGVTNSASGVQDESLGLVPAFFHAGATSVVSTLWEVDVDNACIWLTEFRLAWGSLERRLRRSGASGGVRDMIDMAELTRRAAKAVLDRDGRENGGIDSWAAFVYRNLFGEDAGTTEQEEEQEDARASRSS